MRQRSGQRFVPGTVRSQRGEFNNEKSPLLKGLSFLGTLSPPRECLGSVFIFSPAYH